MSKKRDGSFWMSWKDFVTFFNDFTLCKLPNAENGSGKTFSNEIMLGGKYGKKMGDHTRFFRVKIARGKLNIPNIFFLY